MAPRAEPLSEIIRIRRSEAVTTDTNGVRTERKEYSLRADKSGRRLLFLAAIVMATALLLLILLGTKAVPSTILTLLRFL